MVKVSVIVPHYNTVGMLCKLIESIPDRSEIEIIVVDDCSSDIEAYKNCKEKYSARNIIFIDNEKNIGGGASRNAGIKRAGGEWLLFADSDDYFAKEMWDIISKYIYQDFDIVYFAANYCPESVKNANLDDLPVTKIINKLEIDSSEDLVNRLRYRVPAPWAKLIRAEVVKVNNILFDEISAGNDLFFAAKAGFYCKKWTYSKDVLYYYRYRPDSVSNKMTKERFFDRVGAHVRRNEFLIEKLGDTDSTKKLIASTEYLIKKAALGGLSYKYIKEMMKMLEQTGVYYKHSKAMYVAFKYYLIRAGKKILGHD